MMYRRPPAQPDAAASAGGSWFGVNSAAEPEQPPAGFSRVSYGFGSGPISPNREAPEPPAGQPEPPAMTEPPAGQPALPAHSPVTVDRRPVTTDEFAALRPRTRHEFAALRPTGRAADGLAPVGEAPGSAGGVTSAAPRAAGGATSAAPRAAGGYTGEPPTGDRLTEEFEALRPANEPLHLEVKGVPVAVEPPRRSRLFTAGVVVLSAIVLLGGSIMGFVYFSGSGGTGDAAFQSGAETRTVAAPLGKRTKAGFELLAGAGVVRVSIKELGTDLYRISTPGDAGLRPSPEVRGNDVKLQVTGEGAGTRGEIDVVLSDKVRWSLRFSGYAQEQHLELSGGQVSGIEMVAGTGKAAVTLARASGTVPVRINGAVDQLVLKSPSDSPVRVRVEGGAKSVVAGSRTLEDVAAGSTLTPKNWATQDRYDVSAGARITSLTVENA